MTGGRPSGLRRTARGVGAIVREVALTVLALGGVVCIVLTVLAFTVGFSLIMFKTGSMSPTIPAGSVALVQRIPASEIRIGDVVTVDRADALPVTHRVTGVTASDDGAGSGDPERVITLRGDANEEDDPAPYTVSEVRILRGSVPHLAAVVVWFGHPFVLGGITIGAALLVTWAFWPKERRGGDDDESPAATPESTPPPGEGAPLTRRERRTLGAVGAVALLIMTGAAFLQPAPARADAGSLTLTSDLSGTHRLDAVDPLDWHLDIDGSALADDGELTVALSGADGGDGMQIVAEVRSCVVAWTDSGCHGAQALLRAAAPVALDGGWERMMRIPTPGTAHLRVALTAPDVGAASASASLTIRASASGMSAEARLGGRSDLATTGGPSWAICTAPAAVLIGLGIALIARAHRRSRR